MAYLGAAGYSEMFAAAGYADLVDFARSRPHPKELAARVPEGLIEAVGLVGSAGEVAARMAQYEAAGLAEIGLVVPPLDSPSGRRTLEALAP